MKFLDQSGLVIVQSWINNSFAKVDQAFGTINYAGNVSGITVSQVSTTTNGSPSTVYYDTTGGQFVLKAGNNVYYNNWPNKYVWVVPGINEPWGGVIYKDLSSNKLYKYLPEDASMTACDVTDYPAMRLRDLLADIEMYIAQRGMYAPSQHTHSIANVTGLQAKLDTINKSLTVLGLGQWGAVKVDGVLTNSISASVGGVGNPTAIYIAQSISSPSGTISGIVGKIGSTYCTTWSGTNVPTNLYMKTMVVLITANIITLRTLMVCQTRYTDGTVRGLRSMRIIQIIRFLMDLVRILRMRYSQHWIILIQYLLSQYLEQTLLLIVLLAVHLVQ